MILPPRRDMVELVEIADGTLMGDSNGRLWRVFRPRWWQVARWWRWWRSRERGVVDVTNAAGRVLKVRVEACRLSLLPHVPSQEVVRRSHW